MGREGAEWKGEERERGEGGDGWMDGWMDAMIVLCLEQVSTVCGPQKERKEG